MQENGMGVPTLGVRFLGRGGVLIIRTIVFGDLYWVPPVLGTPVLGATESIMPENSRTPRKPPYLIHSLAVVPKPVVSSGILFHFGGCQNCGPFLGTLNIRCRTIIGIQKRDHNFDNHPFALQ